MTHSIIIAVCFAMFVITLIRHWNDDRWEG